MQKAVMAKVVQLFSNPHAGTYSRRRVQSLVRALQDLGATVVQSFSADAPPEILDGVDHVCIAGGDGTVRHVASAVLRCGRPVTMSIYPVGTVNLLARERLYPACASDFARLVMADAHGKDHFPVVVGEDFFFACASVGPDSMALDCYSPRLKRLIGRGAYGFAFLGLLWRWRRHRIRLNAEGVAVECEAFYVAKGRYYAGPWSLAPASRGDDPLMHVIALERARRIDFARLVLALFFRRAIDTVPGAVCFTTTDLKVESDEALPLQADGDILATLPVRFMIGRTPLSFR
ncbi:MAG TPA: diacylglycerol kinase family protein [Sphingobium sp.]